MDIIRVLALIEPSGHHHVLPLGFLLCLLSVLLLLLSGLLILPSSMDILIQYLVVLPCLLKLFLS
jgi:hypothetical protein